MYLDEDGDAAHEFYVEVPSKKHGVKSTMKRILTGLRPQVIIFSFYLDEFTMNFIVFLIHNLSISQ